MSAALSERAAALLLILPPAEIVALTQVVACSRLYRYPSHFALDAPDEDGDRHLLAPGPVLTLVERGLLRLRADKRVPGSIGHVEDSALGLAVAQLFGWRTVGREWNEMPYDLMHNAVAP